MSKFSGGGTTVQQQAANTTDVTVTSQIANIIDIAPIAAAIEAGAQNTQDLIAQISKAQVIAQLTEAKAKMDQNEILKTSLKYTVAGGAVYLLWRQYNGK